MAVFVNFIVLKTLSNSDEDLQSYNKLNTVVRSDHFYIQENKNIVVKRQNGPSDLKSTLRRVYGQICLATSDWFSSAATHIFDVSVICIFGILMY